MSLTGIGLPLWAAADTVVGAGLTPGEATLMTGLINSIALLTGGILAFLGQRSLRRQQDEQVMKQLDAQREQLDRQLVAQREQMTTQLDEQRQQSEQQLAAQRQLALIQLREETARLFRAEKRAVYVRMLDAARSEQLAWQQLVGQQTNALIPDLQALLQKVVAQKQAADEVAAEIELVASYETYELSSRFQRATAVLLRTLVVETERRLDPGQPGDVTTFRHVQVVLRQQINQEDTQTLYIALRQQMRSELFDLALEPSLRPTPQEQYELRQEVRNLNQDPQGSGSSATDSTAGPSPAQSYDHPQGAGAEQEEPPP